ncbi:hypothetical protein M3Y95_01157300 [Aphelenchoides besseyi]|nr:hypothetical protein M3Y95_01157300 [Aphelenchoides besseyi]
MSKSFGYGALVSILLLLIAGTVEAKCLDNKKVTGDCKDVSLGIASNSADMRATIKIKQGGGKKFRGRITIGMSASFKIRVPTCAFSDNGDAYKSPITIVATSTGVTMQQTSKVPISVCSTAPFQLDAKGKATTNFAFHIDRTGVVEIDLDPSIQVVSSNDDDTNYWITIGIPVAASFFAVLLSSLVGYICYSKNSKEQKVPAMDEKALEKVVVAPMAEKELTKKSTKAHSWAYAKNADIARASRKREIERRKSLPERLSLYQIRRRAHSQNSANAMKKMKAAKAKRDNSDKKVETAKAKRESTKKVSERLDKELVDAKAKFDGKKKISAEVAALDATTPKVKSKSLKVERTQSETSTAHSISTAASTTQATTTRPTADVTTDVTTNFTTDVTTDATTTDDTRSTM